MLLNNIYIVIKKFESFQTVDEETIKEFFVDLSDEFEVRILNLDDGLYTVEVTIDNMFVKGNNLNNLESDINKSKKISMVLEKIKEVISRLSQIDKMEFKYYLEKDSPSEVSQYKLILEMSFNEDYKLQNFEEIW